MKIEKVSDSKKNTMVKESIAIQDQEKLDHDQHYDVDGVSRVDGKIIITESEVGKIKNNN